MGKSSAGIYLHIQIEVTLLQLLQLAQLAHLV